MLDFRCGDALTVLKSLPSGSVQTCVTSPPYFGLRDYGNPNQIGLEKTPEQYVNRLVELFSEVWRLLRDDGTLWLNLGDSYSRSHAKGGSGPNGKNKQKWGHGLAQNAKIGSSDNVVGRASRDGTRATINGLVPKQLIGIPWRVAFALQSNGWILRQDIIWHKPNPMPESVTDRCTKAHEYIFLLSKSEQYFFDAEIIKEPSIYAPGKSHEIERKKGYYAGKWNQPGNGGRNDQSFKAIRELRNKRSVWTIAPKPYKGAHFATFPPDLIKPCIMAGSPPGGVVLDPFLGSGTTGLVAFLNGRQCIGIELNPEYLDLAWKRIACAF